MFLLLPFDIVKLRTLNFNRELEDPERNSGSPRHQEGFHSPISTILILPLQLHNVIREDPFLMTRSTFACLGVWGLGCGVVLALARRVWDTHLPPQR